MRIETFLITGTHELMMHNPAGMKPKDEGLKQLKIPPPDVEAASVRYLTDDGFFYFPAQGFKSSFVAGAVGRKIGKRGAGSVLKAAVFPAEDRCLLIDVTTKKPIPGDKYKVDARRVGLGKYGSVVRGRPLVFPWACLVALEVDDIIENSQLIEDIGNLAGR